jgi:hypothetical protein
MPNILVPNCKLLVPNYLSMIGHKLGIALNGLCMISRRHVIPNIYAQFGHFRGAKTTKSILNWGYNWAFEKYWALRMPNIGHEFTIGLTVSPMLCPISGQHFY